MVFLDLHACTPYVNDLEDDFVPRHGSGITDPRLQSSTTRARIVWRVGRVVGGFAKLVTLYVGMFGERGAPLSGPKTYCSLTFRCQFLKLSSASQRRCARTVLPT